jgi:hypothetical protein
MQEISWLTKDLLASQEGLYSMELVIALPPLWQHLSLPSPFFSQHLDPYEAVYWLQFYRFMARFAFRIFLVMFPVWFHTNSACISLVLIYMPHAPPTSSSLIESPQYYFAKSTDYEATNAFSTSILLLLPSLGRSIFPQHCIFEHPQCSFSNVIKFCANTKHHGKLYFCVF